MSEAPMPLAAPSRHALWGEARVALDFLQMLPALRDPGRDVALAAVASPIMVLPGFGASDAAMWPLRRFLTLKGLQVEGWALGVNRAGLDRPHTLADISPGWGSPQKVPYRREAGVAHLCDLVARRVSTKAQALGRPMTLIGWSLGGSIAREVARDLPDTVDQIITLGSPVIGGPKYTAGASVLKSKGLDLDWIEAQVKKRDARPIQQPITSIISRSDGIVSWSAAVDRISPRVRHIEVKVSHLGMGFSPTVWQHIVDTLAVRP